MFSKHTSDIFYSNLRQQRQSNNDFILFDTPFQLHIHSSRYIFFKVAIIIEKQLNVNLDPKTFLITKTLI